MWFYMIQKRLIQYNKHTTKTNKEKEQIFLLYLDQQWLNCLRHKLTTTIITTSSVIPLMRIMGRSKCEQPYPWKYHYLQRGWFKRPTKDFRKTFWSWLRHKLGELKLNKLGHVLFNFKDKFKFFTSYFIGVRLLSIYKKE